MPASRLPLRPFAIVATLIGALSGCGGGSDNTSASETPAPETTPDPKSGPLQVLVPAYFYPLPGSPWEQLTRSAQSQPSVGITAIVNPSNGSGTKADAQFTQALTAFTQAGGKVIGYVPTRYGNGRYSLADVRLHIDRYLAFYGREHISGFFLDEMAATSQPLAFYRDIYQYVKGLDNRLRVVGNPGALPLADYAAVADTLVTFEGQASAYSRFNPGPSHGWIYQYGNGKQAMLVHDATDCPAMQAALNTAASARSNTGWVYVTDQHYDYATNTGNPWAALPAYWEQMLSTVNAINKDRALPGC